MGTVQKNYLGLQNAIRYYISLSQLGSPILLALSLLSRVSVHHRSFGVGQQMLMAGAASCRDVQGIFDSPTTQNSQLSFVRAFSPILFVIILYNNRHSWDHSPPYVLHLISPCTQLHNTTTAASLEIVRQQLSAFCLFSKGIEYLFILSIYFLSQKRRGIEIF